jgi:hypothetical protein
MANNFRQIYITKTMMPTWTIKLYIILLRNKNEQAKMYTVF